MFKTSSHKILTLVFLLSLLYLGSCQYDNFPEPEPPKQPTETAQLEAAFTTSPPVTINHSFWRKSDFRVIELKDIFTGQTYPDGYLNMTGTYGGIQEVNGGVAQPLTLKSAYDNEKLYVLMEWYDDDLDASAGNWLLDGPKDPRKGDATVGWTSQRNSDMISLAFDINQATSSSGNFVNAGCAASCHNGAMKPETGKADIWKWSLALSDALGYAMDAEADATTGLNNDAGTPMAVRNSLGSDGRSGPKYVWDGNAQAYTRPDDKATLLDPGFYLLNKKESTADFANGNTVYQNQCARCHGDNAEGGDGPGFNTPGVLNRFSSSALDHSTSDAKHSGNSYYNALSTKDKADVIERVKAFASIPGYYLQEPTGSNTDIWAISNVSHIALNTRSERTVYKVLLIRDLVNSNADDVQFENPSGQSFPFGIAVMDNDGPNHVGSALEFLTFKAKN